MSVSIPENGVGSGTVADQMLNAAGPQRGVPDAQTMQNFGNLKIGPNIGALLSAVKAPQANLAAFSGHHSPASLVKQGGIGNDLGSAVKNIIDFISTPFYMATNAADMSLEKEDQGQDYQSVGSFLDDIRQGVQRGWEAGINHNPEFAKDWGDVITHAQKGTPDDNPTGNAIARAVAIPMDMVIDPINALPGVGLGKMAIKAPGAIAGAMREASGAGARVLAKGAEAASAAGAEPLAEGASKAAQSADRGPFVVAQSADRGPFVVDSEGTATAPVEAPAAPEATSLTPEQSLSEFQSNPSIQKIIQNQAKGPLKAGTDAFLQTVKDSVKTSDLSKILSAFKEGYGGGISSAEKAALKTPIPATPSNIAQAHEFGITDKENLDKEPIPTMAVPKAIEAPKPKPAEEVKPSAPAATKQADLISAAANNTLAKESWQNMNIEQRLATRNAEAAKRWNGLDTPETLGVQNIGKKATELPAEAKQVTVDGYTQKSYVADIVDKAKKNQAGLIDEAGNELPEIGNKGYKGDVERTKGATAKEAGGIVHPMVYDAHASQLPFRETLRAIHGAPVVDEAGNALRHGNGQPKLEGGINHDLLPESNRVVSKYDKPKFVAKILKAVESQLFAKGMTPALGMSKYATEASDLINAIHISLGDMIEAAVAKSIKTKEGKVWRTKSLVTEKTIADHLVGSAKKDAINPLAFQTAGETLIRGRKIVFDALKSMGGKATNKDVAAQLNKLEDDIHDVLMVKDSAFSKNATPEDMANMRATRDAAIEARDKLGTDTSYKDSMRDLAHALVYDPHYGSMLEQRHLYNSAMHQAEIARYTAKKWGLINANILRYAQSNWNSKQITQWLEKTIKQSKEVLPEFDRTQFSDWIDDLKAQVISPEEELAAMAKDSRETIAGSGKDAAPVVAESFKEDFPITLSDMKLGQVITDTLRAMHPVKSFFDAKYPFRSGFYDTVMSGLHSRARLQNAFNQDIYGHIVKNGSLRDDFAKIQSKAVDGEELSGTAQELDKIVNAIVGDDVRYIESLRNKTLNAQYFKDMLDRHNVGSYIDEKWLSKAEHTQLADFWRHTNLKDNKETADFLSKLHGMSAHIYNDQAITAAFEKEFGSAVPKEGYVKITWNSGRGRSTDIIRSRGYAAARAKAEKAPGFYDALNRNLYFEKNAAMEVPLIHRLMNESRKISNDTMLGQFVNNIFDPVTQIMKAFQTTLRPGHWISNLMGDHVRLYMAGVHVGAIAPSYRVLGALGRDLGMFKDIPDKLDRLTKLANKEYTYKLPKGDVMIPIRINGTTQMMSATEIGRRLEDMGVIVSPHAMGQHEDFINSLDTNASSKLIQSVNGALDTVLNKKFLIGKSVNEFGALRDNVTRVPIAMDTLLKGDFKTMDEAFKQAFARVRKWAPTSQDFTREESMYARRVMFYYTWLRGMLPNVVETLMTKPGVFLAPNKALYSIAKANGVDPISIGNPFPAGQLFPSYYYDNVIGPQIKLDGGQLWGFSPMAPTIDVLDTVLKGFDSTDIKQNNVPGAVGQNIIGMMNPFIQIPDQLMTGESGGVPIKDPAQFLQDQILPPQLDLISKMTGKEAYTGFTQNRTDKQNVNPTADLLNFLTGTHLTDYNSPAAQRAVVGEAKAAKTATKADIRRANS